MNQRRIAGSELVTQLTHRFDEGQRLDVAHRTADLGNNHIVLLALRQQLNAALDFVRDMRNDLHGLAQVLALALLVDHALINLTGGHVVGMAGRNRSETLVMPQVEVGFRTVFGHVTLSVLVRIQGSGVDIDIGIQFLNRHRIATCLQQAGDRRRNNAFTERRSHAARHENVLGFVEFHYLFRIILFAPSFVRLRFKPYPDRYYLIIKSSSRSRSSKFPRSGPPSRLRAGFHKKYTAIPAKRFPHRKGMCQIEKFGASPFQCAGTGKNTRHRGSRRRVCTGVHDRAVTPIITK